MKHITPHLLVWMTATVFACQMPVARACSDLLLPPGASGEDQSVVSARTMDFAQNMSYYFDVVPRNYHFESDNPPGWNDQYGLKWQGKYGFVGVSALWTFLFKNNGNGTRYFDGMNEKGLSAALLWLDRANSGFPEPVDGVNNVSIQHVVAYVLSTCETVSEATNELSKVHVWQEQLAWDIAVPLLLHMVVHDANGDTALIEWYDGQPHYHGPAEMNNLRIVCNDPAIAGHVAIATNWSMLTAANGFKSPADDRHLDSNYVTLPGDSSSASRYLRLKKLNDAFLNYYEPFQNIWPMEHPDMWRIHMANRIIGRSEEVYGEFPDVGGFFHTIFTLIRDHTHQRIYFRGVYNSNLKMIDLSQINFTNQFACRPWLYLDPNPAEASHYEDQAQDVTAILGSQMNYGSVFNAQSNTKFSMDYTFACQTSTVPDQGMMFIYCRTPDQRLLCWNGTQWVENTDITNRALIACYTGSLVNVTFSNLFQNLPVADWTGAHIYAGYGSDQADMLIKNNYQLIGVVRNPFQTVEEHLTNVVLNASANSKQLGWQGYDGYFYDISTSTNLFAGWQSAGTITGTYGIIQFPIDETQTQTFYRVGTRFQP
jgi:penicillin V acylase-like amidase (Ntn superfamily)